MGKSINSFVFAALVIAACLHGSIANASDITGTVDNVVDRDTFDICTDQFCPRIRICGFDAPDRSEVGGSAAKAFLASLILGKVVRCRPVGQGTVCDGRSRPTNGNRIVAQCYI